MAWRSAIMRGVRCERGGEAGTGDRRERQIGQDKEGREGRGKGIDMSFS